MQTPITSYHISHMWHKWNVNANDVMITWFTLYLNHVVSHVDRIFTIKLEISQSLMLQEETYNPNVTLKGYPKKFWVCLVKKLTTNHTISPQKRMFILNPKEPWTDLQP